MGLNLKHDIRINLKHEKEVFRFIRLLIFTFIFSAVFLGIPDYIWNMILWRISVLLCPWLVAVPAVINLKTRGVKLRTLLGERILWQFAVGCAVGTMLAAVWLLFNYFVLQREAGMFYFKNVWEMLYVFIQYMCVVGPSEELIYRFAIMGSMEELCEKCRWLAPLVANLLFALSHIFQTNWFNVLFAFVFGGVYTLFTYRWKKCGLVMASAMHGMFDFMIVLIPYLMLASHL